MQRDTCESIEQQQIETRKYEGGRIQIIVSKKTG
jgi:hypothetical protein